MNVKHYYHLLSASSNANAILIVNCHTPQNFGGRPNHDELMLLPRDVLVELTERVATAITEELDERGAVLVS